MPANQSTPEVTRADREAAMSFLKAMWHDRYGNVTYPWMRDEEGATLSGKRDNDWAVRAATRHRLSLSPARGGDELREAAQAMIDWIGAKDIRVYASDPVVRNLAAALASTDMAGAGEGFKWPEPKFLPVQSGTELNPARVTAAFELINRELVVGEQFRLVEMLLDGTEYSVAAPPVEGLTSGEGDGLAANVRGIATVIRAFPNDKAWGGADQAEEAALILDRAASALAASPKATATASDQISRENDQ